MRRVTTRFVGDEPERPDGDGYEVYPADFIQLVATDFSGIYQVYIAASDERLKMLRLAMSLLSAPFAAVIALTSAKVIDARQLTSWEFTPWYVFAIVTVFGVLSILPYLRLIEATARHMRTARAVNNFRLLYIRELREHFDELAWRPNLPMDPDYPETFAPTSGPGITIVGLAIVNAAYIAVGMLGMSGAEPTALVITTWTMLTALTLFLIYYIRSNVSRRRRQPANPFGFPSVES